MKRVAWACLGWIMVALGFIGALLPVMPTTIFLIMAVACFARSSPRLEAWLLNHPKFGAPLRQWREQGAISRKGKMFALGGMTVGYVLLVLSAPGAAALWGAGVFMLGSAVYVVTRPTAR